MSAEEKTAKELIENAVKEVMDGFDTYGDELDRRLLQGTQIKFTNAYTWVTRAGEETPTNEDFIASNVKRVEAKWTKNKNAPPETRVLLPGEKFRDMKKLNEETPKSEWIEGPNGQLKGPWENQHYLYLLDRLMKRYTYVASTIGGNIAVSELVQQVGAAKAALHHRGLHQKARRGRRRQTSRTARSHRDGEVGAARQANREASARR